MGPRPGALQTQAGAPPGSGEVPGLVPESESEPFRFGLLEVAGQQEGLGPGDEVLTDQDESEPYLVGLEVGEGKIRQPGVFGLRDALLGVGASSLPGFEERDVGVGLVGEEHLETVPVEIGEGELGAGMGVFSTGDGSGSFRPRRQIHQGGHLGDFGALAFFGPVRRNGWGPIHVGDTNNGFGRLDSEGEPHRETDPTAAAGVDEIV